MNSIYCQQRARQTDRQRGRERARKRGCYFRPGVVMETAASLQMETSRKHMDRQTNGIRKAQHDATPQLRDSVHHPHWHLRLQSDDSGVLFITQNEYQWESVCFFFFREQWGGGREILRVKGCVTGNGVHSVSESSPFSLSFNWQPFVHFLLSLPLSTASPSVCFPS